MKIKINDILFFVSLLMAIWFAITGIICSYMAALVIAYPIGIISFIIWLLIKHENKKRTRLIPITLTVGLTVSLFFLALLFIG